MRLEQCAGGSSFKMAMFGYLHLPRQAIYGEMLWFSDMVHVTK